MSMTSAQASANPAESPAAEQERPRRRRKHRWRGIPAPWVFYSLVLLGLASVGLVFVRGLPYMPLAVGFCLLTCVALVINDRKGFIRRRQMRRAFEARRNFNNLEVLVLVGLVMGNAYVTALAFLA